MPTIEILAQKVHPLALGNVERFLSQSRLIARKILLTQMNDEATKHKIDDIIETLASKLYFHGHPINRREARIELGLKVLESVSSNLETLIWELYKDFEIEMKNREPFDPAAELWKNAPAPLPVAGGTPAVPSIPIGSTAEIDLILVMIESAVLSSKNYLQRRFVVVGQGPSFEPIIRQENLGQGWDHQPAQKPAPKK